VAWNGVDGRLSRVEVTSTGLTARGLAGAVSANAVHCAVPIDAGGRTDLAVASANGATAEVLVGGGDGDWGRRIAIGDLGPWAVGDVDGDLVDDLIAAVDGPALKVFWGGEHQLAHGPASGQRTPAVGIVAGDFTGDGRASVFVKDDRGNVGVAPSSQDGRFASPEFTSVEEASADFVGLWLPTLFGGGASTAPVAADLGGAEPGVDLLWTTWDPTPPASGRIAFALVRDGPNHAFLVASPAVDWNLCDIGPGLSPGELFAFCYDWATREASAWRSALSADTVPSFNPWDPVGTVALVGSTAPVTIRAAGVVGGVAYAFVGDNVGRSNLVQVDDKGAIATQEVATLRWDERAIPADLDGQPGVDVLLRAVGLRSLIDGGAGAFIPGPDSTRVPGAKVAPIRLAPAAPHDLLVGDPGSTSVLLLRNNGFGRFE
jgi:hypothetical protein